MNATLPQRAVKISIVQNCTKKETEDIELGRVLEAIRDGKWRTQIEKIREAYRNGGAEPKRAIDALKKKVPAVMFSGRFKHRASDALLKHSGLICADLDSLGDKLPQVRVDLSSSPHLFALFVSPSCDGLKAIFRVPADPYRHRDSFRAVARHVFKLTGVRIDESGKDPARLCFVSFDPEMKISEDATEIESLPPEPKPQLTQTGVANLAERQRIAVDLLGQIDWQSETHGFLPCPAKHLHTTSDGVRDCEIHLDGAPTLFCFHAHCRGFLDGLNHELRSQIGKAEFAAQNAEQSSVPHAIESKSLDDDQIKRLAALPILEYERKRKEAAEKLGCRESVLDRLVDVERLLSRPCADALQGTAVKLPEIELWPEPVRGAEILNAIAKRFSHYVVLLKAAADMLALWCAGTHMFRLFQITPRLSVSSPMPECGKTTLRDTAALFCARSVKTENMTTAVMFRLVSGHAPTILADECDKWLYLNEELRGLLCSGHRNGGYIMRCEGDSNELRQFGCYAPVLLAAIGALPDQLHSRSIVVRLERAKEEEIKACARFNLQHVQYENELCRKLARWIADNREQIAACQPKLPEHLFNRIADNWIPIFAIAEVAGGDWPERCRQALIKLTTREDEADSLRVMLLEDIKQVFVGDRMFSKDLIAELSKLSERPWPEVCRGKPITERWLARNLAAFGIRSKTLRIDEERAKGYEADAFVDAFDRYLTPSMPREGDFMRDSVTYEAKPENLSMTKGENVTDKKSRSTKHCHGVTDKKGGKCASDGLLGYMPEDQLIREVQAVFPGATEVRK